VRVSPLVLVVLGAIAALVALGVTDQVLPATDPRVASVRPWVAARALGVTAYLLLALDVALGLVLSHPRNTTEWRKTKQVFPWHEMLTVFIGAFLALHIALLAIYPFAGVGVLGAFVPGLSHYRTPAVAIGTVALYALIFTAVTAKWTRLLPAGWWLKVHRFSAVIFLMAWVHGVLSGTDSGSLLPMYLATGLLVVAGVAHRWWTARARPLRAHPSSVVTGDGFSPRHVTVVRPQPVAVLEDH
jgi:methionine sulfoxide reductase heme-binding subunit